MIDECIHCDEPIGWDKWCDPHGSGDMLHEHCREDWEQGQNERAYERFCEDFYGGSGPCTVEEHYQAAAKQRREMER